MGKQNKTGISWTDATWSPIVGCTRVSPGCDHCWAERMARVHYHKDFPNGWSKHGAISFPERLEQPMHWKKPRRIAVGLMGDLFHESVPDRFIDRIFAMMALCPQHTFQVLTKRPMRMRDYFNGYPGSPRNGFISYEAFGDARTPIEWPIPNVWLGVSAENQAAADERIALLIETPAAIKFISGEPLLGLIDFRKVPGFNRIGFDLSNWWVIAGGESGPGARPCHPDWVKALRDQCQAARVPFHFKQWGEWTSLTPSSLVAIKKQYKFDDGLLMHRVGKKAAGRLLDGKEYLEFPRTV